MHPRNQGPAEISRRQRGGRRAAVPLAFGLRVLAALARLRGSFAFRALRVFFRGGRLLAAAHEARQHEHAEPGSRRERDDADDDQRQLRAPAGFLLLAFFFRRIRHGALLSSPSGG